MSYCFPFCAAFLQLRVLKYGQTVPLRLWDFAFEASNSHCSGVAMTSCCVFVCHRPWILWEVPCRSTTAPFRFYQARVAAVPLPYGSIFEPQTGSSAAPECRAKCRSSLVRVAVSTDLR